MKWVVREDGCVGKEGKHLSASSLETLQPCYPLRNDVLNGDHRGCVMMNGDVIHCYSFDDGDHDGVDSIGVDSPGSLDSHHDPEFDGHR